MVTINTGNVNNAYLTDTPTATYRTPYGTFYIYSLKRASFVLCLILVINRNGSGYSDWKSLDYRAVLACC